MSQVEDPANDEGDEDDAQLSWLDSDPDGVPGGVTSVLDSSALPQFPAYLMEEVVPLEQLQREEPASFLEDGKRALEELDQARGELIAHLKEHNVLEETLAKAQAALENVRAKLAKAEAAAASLRKSTEEVSKEQNDAQARLLAVGKENQRLRSMSRGHERSPRKGTGCMARPSAKETGRMARPRNVRETRRVARPQGAKETGHAPRRQGAEGTDQVERSRRAKETGRVARPRAEVGSVVRPPSAEDSEQSAKETARMAVAMDAFNRMTKKPRRSTGKHKRPPEEPSSEDAHDLGGEAEPPGNDAG